jgi:HAD superfamily hydrolase (TIGR01509 family)
MAASDGVTDVLSTFRPRGAVFDLDGTLVNNMALHAEAFDRFARQHALPTLTPALRLRIDGKRNSEIFPMLFERPLTPEEIQRYEDMKEGAYREISKGRLAPLAGLPRLLAGLERHGIPAAIATSAPALNVAHTLAELGLLERLTTVVRGDEVPRGKPEPDIFLAAASRLGVTADACLAFEDAPLGIAAARAAGMRCVGIATGFSRDELAAQQIFPDLIVGDFDEFLASAGRWLAG